MKTKYDKMQKFFFELSKDAVLISNDRIYIDCNQAALNVLGYKRKEELINKPILNHSVEYQFDGMKSSKKLDEYYSTAGKKGSVQYEWGFKKADGLPVTVNVSLTHIPDQQNSAFIEIWKDFDFEKNDELFLNILYKISNIVNTSKNPDELYESVHRAVHRVLDATNFFIALYDNKKDLILFPYEKDELFKYDKIENASESTAMSIRVIRENRALLIDKSAFPKDSQWGTAEQWLGVPLNVKDEVIGVIAVQSYHTPDLYGNKEVQFLTAVSDLISLAIDRNRTEEALVASRSEILAKSYKSEIADITSGSLHNVKNILTSVKVSNGLIKENISGSTLQSLKKANNLLRENIDTLEKFILEDPKGKKLLHFYLKIEDIFQKQFTNANTHINRLSDKVDSIESIISTQQGYGGSDKMEKININSVLEDALIMQSGSNASYGIKILKDFKPVNVVEVQKTKLIHILINIIKNARESMIEKGGNDNILSLKLFEKNSAVIVKISDTGVGLSEQNKTNIFSHGFTTKKNGHGFGLVSCKAYMEEMNGELIVESDGINRGASFSLVFPLK
jgi:signal transduction histidine kinase